MENVICVVNPDEKHFLKDMGAENLCNYYTPQELYQEMQNGNIVISESVGRMREHLWLTRYPGDQVYVCMTEANENLNIARKISAIESIAYHLGCAVFIAESYKSIAQKVGIGFNANQALNVSEDISIQINNGLDARGDLSGNEESRLTTEVRWSGEYNSDSYDKAKEIAEAKHLIDELAISDLLEQRRIENPNRLVSKNYSVNVLKDVNANADLASKMNAELKLIFGGNSDFKLTANLNSRAQTEFKFKVQFLSIEELSVADVKREIAGIGTELEKRALKENVDKRFDEISNDIVQKAESIESELKKRALTENINKQFDEITKDITQKAESVDSELRRRALTENVDKQFDELSNDIAQKAESIGSELRKRALTENVNKQFDEISKDISQKSESINSEICKKADKYKVEEIYATKENVQNIYKTKIESETDYCAIQHKIKIWMFLFIGIGLVAISGLIMAIYIISKYS